MDMHVQVTTYGTRGLIEEVSPLRRYHSCTMFNFGDVRVCVDCGSPELFQKLEKCDVLVITHGHPDHVGGLVGHTVAIPTVVGEFSLKFNPTPPYWKKINFRKLKVVRRGFRVKDLRVELVPAHHSLRCPMCLVYFPDVKLMIATDVIAPVGGWKAWRRRIRYYIGDCSSPVAPIIRRKNGKVYGHASAAQQIKALGDDVFYLFTHHGRQTVGLNEKEVAAKVGYEVRAAKDGDVFVVTERGFEKK